MPTDAAIDPTPFVRAVVCLGHSRDFAEDAAKGVMAMAALTTPSYPGRFTLALGVAGYLFSADVVDGKLVFQDMQQVHP